jgi:hypothetical protein
VTRAAPGPTACNDVVDCDDVNGTGLGTMLDAPLNIDDGTRVGRNAAKRLFCSCNNELYKHTGHVKLISYRHKQQSEVRVPNDIDEGGPYALLIFSME